MQDLSRSFDAYWNNERAYPVQSLVSREELDEMRDRRRTADAAERDTADGIAGADAPAAAQGDAPTAEQRAPRLGREAAWTCATPTFVWAPAVVLVDKPGKIPPDGAACGIGNRPRARLPASW